jgi:GT2 family glycosyltransferase
VRDTRSPLLSVVLVSFGSRDDLERLLPTLYREAVNGLEVIVVDNRPGDGTTPWLETHYPDVRILAAKGNLGYAGGNNLGIAAAEGSFVLILNPDTELHEGALEHLLYAARSNPDALITAALLQPDGSLNACGLQFHYTGVTSCRHLGQEASAHKALHAVPLLSGAAFIAPKKILTSLGGFSEPYFMYFEDVDLSLRAKLSGYRLLCAGDAHVTHHYGLSMSANKFYLLERNRLLTLFRLYQTRTFWRLAPGLLLTEGLIWAFALFRGPTYVWARVRGYLWLWRQRFYWQAERRIIQQGRTVNDDQLLASASSELPIDQLVRNAPLARFLSRLTKGIYTSTFLSPRELR